MNYKRIQNVRVKISLFFTKNLVTKIEVFIKKGKLGKETVLTVILNEFEV